MKVYRFPQNQSYSQARRHPRLAAPFIVRLGHGGKPITLRNLSQGGVGLDSDEPPNPMALVNLVFEVPSVGSLESLARVMWVRGTWVGLRFEKVDPRLIEALGDLEPVG